MLRLSLLAALTLATQAIYAAHWPNWRGGADGSGITQESELPLRWSATERLAWKIPLPDRGNSTPVIWEDKIFLTQATEQGKRRSLLCLSKADGKLLWQQSVDFAESEATHPTNPYCSASPSTDGERIVVCHGSAGVFCYDLTGKELWRRDLGRQEFEWGNGSSPVIHGDRVFLYFGPGKGARLLALDKQTGQDRWKFDEPPVNAAGRTDGFRGSDPGMICSYATPIVIKSGDREELIMLFPGSMRSFDPASGRELWHCDGMNPLVYCSPIVGEGVAVGMGGFFGTSIAVALGGQGDLTSQRLWQAVRTKNRLGSGLIHEGYIYILNTDGNAECLELKTGKSVYLQRLKPTGPNGESWSSMVRSGDRIYILNQSGDCHVLRASPKFELLATNSIGNELTNASLAVSDGRLFLRTHKHLWCFQ